MPVLYLPGIFALKREKYMRKIIYKSTAIKFIVFLIATLLLLSFWLFDAWKEPVDIGVQKVTETYTPAITKDKNIVQSFIPQYDHLQKLTIHVSPKSTGKGLYVRLLDGSQRVIAEEYIEYNDRALDTYTVTLDVDTEVGGTCFLIFQGHRGETYLSYEQISAEDMPGAGIMYYDNEQVFGAAVAAKYTYAIPLRLRYKGLYSLAIVLLAIGVCFFVKKFYEDDENPLYSVEKVFKVCMNPLVSLMVLASLITIIMGLWSKHLLDNTFFVISILLFAGVVFYGINHKREGQDSAFSVNYIREHFSELVQSVMIAFALGATCEYMNDFYDIQHSISERKEMLFFSLAVIAMFKAEEIFNLINLVYIVLAGISGIIYGNLTVRNIKQGIETGLYREEELSLHTDIIWLTVSIAVLLGFILIRTIRGFCQKKLAKFDLFYAIVTFIFLASLIIFRNTRWWTVTLAIAFTIFYLNYGMWDKKKTLLLNICRGILLHFGWSLIYCLMYRPYTSYTTARYPFIFHTVTVTAYYLTLVEGAAAVVLFSKLQKSRKLRDTWKEWVLFGVVSSYMIFTLSRTGIASVAVMFLFALIILSGEKGIEKGKNILKNMGCMVLAVLVCLPICFTFQRTIPCLVSKPFAYDIEKFTDDASRGRKLSSPDFIRVGRFAELFMDKVLSIEEGTFDIYGEYAQYRKEHEAYINGIVGVYEDDEEYEEKMQDAVTDEEREAAAQEIYLENKEEVDADFWVRYDEIQEKEKQELERLTLNIVEEEAPAPVSDYTNGRKDIYRCYLQQLNFTGHDTMGALLDNGEIATHAHDVYLQVAYDHGIFVGILFILFGILSFVKSIAFYMKNKGSVTCASLPLMVIVAVAVAGIVEWLFHLSNPCGLILMMVICPFIFSENKEK